jgi:hypothetical protein
MAYLYSAPLVFIDDSGEIKPVPELEHQAEQQRVLETLKEMHLAIRWRAYVATTHNFLAAVSQCHVLHFTGHGEDGNVMFEDEHGKGLLKSQQQIQDLFSGAVSCSANKRYWLRWYRNNSSAFAHLFVAFVVFAVTLVLRSLRSLSLCLLARAIQRASRRRSWCRAFRM